MCDEITFNWILEYVGLSKEQIADAWILYNDMESIFDGNFNYFMTWIGIWFLKK